MTHKGRRVRIVPEGRPVNPLSRITPVQIVDCGESIRDDAALLAEMTRSWEADWERYFGPSPERESPASRAEP